MGVDRFLSLVSLGALYPFGCWPGKGSCGAAGEIPGRKARLFVFPIASPPIGKYHFYIAAHKCILYFFNDV